MRASRRMDHAKNDDARPRSRGALRPSFSINPPSSKTEGAGNAGCGLHPWSACNKKHAAEPQVQPEQPGIPRAMVLRLIRDLPGDRTFLSPSPRIIREDLAPALGRQDHTISPSAMCCSSRNTPRPSHPAPNVRDDRETPLLWVRDAREHGFDLPDGARGNVHDGQFAHGVHASLSQPSLRATAKQSRLSPQRQTGLLRRVAPRNDGPHSPLVIPGRRGSVEPGIHFATEYEGEWTPGPRLARPGMTAREGSSRCFS